MEPATDWNDDFEFGEEVEDTTPRLQVIGLKADPTKGENWDSDFSFSGDEGTITIALMTWTSSNPLPTPSKKFALEH